MPKVRSNGINMYFEEGGDGPPLLLISGLGATHLSWALALPGLRDAFRCITFDNRGTGETDVPPGPYTIDQMADDAAGLIDALGIAPVLAVGVSLGGSVLQSLLINHGVKVSRAVLVSAFPSYTEVQHAWLDAGLTLRRAGVPPLVQAIQAMPWGTTMRVLADHSKAYARAKLFASMPPVNLAGYEAQAAAIRVYDSRPRLGEIKTPTLVLVGAEDVLTPVHQSVEIASLIPSAELVVMPRGGHGMLVEYMDDTLPRIRAFLQREPHS